MSKDNLIAREKEEKITFWFTTIMIGLCYNILENNRPIVDWIWYLFLIPMTSSVFALLFDWLSNTKFYVTVENNPECKTIYILKKLDKLKFWALGISLISFTIIYILSIFLKY